MTLLGGTDFRGFVQVPKTGSAVLFLHDTWNEGQMVDRGVNARCGPTFFMTNTRTNKDPGVLFLKKLKGFSYIFFGLGSFLDAFVFLRELFSIFLSSEVLRTCFTYLMAGGVDNS